MAQTRKSTKKASATTKSSTAKKTSAAKSGVLADTAESAERPPSSVLKSAPKSASTSASKRASAKAPKSTPQKVTQTSKRTPEPAAPDAEHPDLALARGLAEIVAAYNLDKLTYETGELKLGFKRLSARAVGPAEPAAAVQAEILRTPAIAAVAAPQASAPRSQLGSSRATPFASLVQEPTLPLGPYRERSHLEVPEGEYHIITSPFVGTFYRRPSPDHEAYVTLGSRVSKGQVLCIIEAMKLMNEIESDASGTVADILVEDAQPVEYGQALFKLLIA